MKFTAEQVFTASTTEVSAAFADPALIATLDLPFVGRPELVSHQLADDRDAEAGVVTLAVRYLPQLDLPAAARAFVDPGRLGFVEHSRLNPDGSGTFRIAPDHYTKLLQSSGSFEVTPTAEGCVRTIRTELHVDLGWKGMLFRDQVQDVIARGFQQALAAQVGAVEDFIASG